MEETWTCIFSGVFAWVSTGTGLGLGWSQWVTVATDESLPEVATPEESFPKVLMKVGAEHMGFCSVCFSDTDVTCVPDGLCPLWFMLECPVDDEEFDTDVL